MQKCRLIVLVLVVPARVDETVCVVRPLAGDEVAVICLVTLDLLVALDGATSRP